MTDNDAMADEDAPPSREGHPVLTGLLALVGVGVVVGLILGGGALVATKVLGIGDDGAASDGTSSGQSMYLPDPEKTESASGPLVTLESDPEASEETSEPEATESTKKPEESISLSAGQTDVSPMQQIDLTGTYPGGEGAILQVQRLEGGKWDDFPVTASVSNETFSTYIQTSQIGKNRFRMVDTDTGKTSNEVQVTIR